jgi:hypothetical protein
MKHPTNIHKGVERQWNGCGTPLEGDERNFGMGKCRNGRM